MARTKRELTPEQNKTLTEAAAEIVKALQGDFFTLDGTPMASVKMEDETFRRKPLVAGWEYSLAYIYYGKRGIPLFGFEPEDKQPYTHVEFELADLDTYLPLFGHAMAEKFLKIDPLPENAVAAYPLVIDQILAEQLAAAERAKAEEAKAFTDNPIFGMF